MTWPSDLGEPPLPCHALANLYTCILVSLWHTNLHQAWPTANMPTWNKLEFWPTATTVAHVLSAGTMHSKCSSTGASACHRDSIQLKRYLSDLSDRPSISFRPSWIGYWVMRLAHTHKSYLHNVPQLFSNLKYLHIYNIYNTYLNYLQIYKGSIVL